jgi:hypothetical protein
MEHINADLGEYNWQIFASFLKVRQAKAIQLKNIKIQYFQNIVADTDLCDFFPIIFRGPVLIEMRLTWNILSMPGMFEIFYSFKFSYVL